jgi:NADH:ubiquinone oxidoreductase subunit 6 (subunit J)
VSVGTGEAVAFGVTAFLILLTGFLSSYAKRTFHSVIWLGACLVSVGALFVLLGSPLVGVLQILVYVGGILTLFIFAVMFVTGDETEEGEVSS